MSIPSTVESPIPAPVRRIVTGHSPEGKSIIVEDAPVEPHLSFPGSKSLSSDIYWTTEHVPDNDIIFKDHANEHANELVGPAGNSFKVIDMPPGQKSVMILHLQSFDIFANVWIAIPSHRHSRLCDPYARTVEYDPGR